MSVSRHLAIIDGTTTNCSAVLRRVALPTSCLHSDVYNARLMLILNVYLFNVAYLIRLDTSEQLNKDPFM